MNEPQNRKSTVKDPLVLDVLTVADPAILGETIPLKIAGRCKFSNAKGNLREIDGMGDIIAMAEASATRFVTAVKPNA